MLRSNRRRPRSSVCALHGLHKREISQRKSPAAGRVCKLFRSSFSVREYCPGSDRNAGTPWPGNLVYVFWHLSRVQRSPGIAHTTPGYLPNVREAEESKLVSPPAGNINLHENFLPEFAVRSPDAWRP